jgi:phosphoribosylaminoimidazole-succinocarboxamide synthase
MMMNSSALAAYVQYTLAESFIPELPGRYRGKVRENYDLRDSTRILIATDRISAFDRILAAIPLKGCFAAGEPPDTLDKDFIRRWVAARCDPYKDQIPEIPPDVILEAAARYVNLYEQLTGQELELPEATVPPLTRIRANLKKYFEMAA